MPSPFPGMDPFLEATGVWPDVHNRLATGLSDVLNLTLPRPYYAAMEMRAELGIVAELPPENGSGPSKKHMVPDILVLKHAKGGHPAGGIAVIEAPTRTVSPRVDFDTLSDEPARQYFVEIRDATRGHKLVTLIEIVSHSNKRPGPDRTAYEAKQAKILDSDVNLIEIDLLRAGKRLLPTQHLVEGVSRISPPATYVVMVSTAERRWPPILGYSAYPCGLREPLPCIEVPLRPDDPIVALDLQAAFDRVYDGGPYRRGAVDYDAELDPPLDEDDTAWVRARLREASDAARGTPGLK